MADSQELIDALDNRVRRRESRRSFFTDAIGAAAGSAALAMGGRAAAQSTPTPTPSPSPSPTSTAAPITDADVLNFALNLEYLEANFYAFAATGSPLAAADIAAGGATGTGTAVAATGGRRVTFTDPAVAQYAREIAADELAHVRFLRTNLGTAAVAQPAIDLSTGPTSAFGRAAVAAGLPATFDPYSSDENFLLGAYIFEDVGVSAYKGSATLLSSKTFLEAAAGILAVEAYHAAIIRTSLYRKGLATPALIDATEGIAAARNALDGRPTEDLIRGIAPNDDQGIRPIATPDGTASNIVPVNVNGIAFSRTAPQVLNIVYLNAAAVTAGGFFPAGVNGTIKTSAAST
ncbi:ferritin-like domain-containing protein [Sphingomonas corticis]|jgi:hypothetical protein|uniref:Ferritin-like domain-containing protein n=1 Tax=Sphingomonas corticis TaxID=2722791 RepID=A0ABX1CMI2_9SPHN|nr:ferritin-like domain-containing protein [Sphingomonas corticis]NJR77560.1 ferritin-like domain-containing protein [Sphingomonas corticis]